MTQIDEFTREYLAIRVARRINSFGVLETIADVMLSRPHLASGFQAIQKIAIGYASSEIIWGIPEKKEWARTVKRIGTANVKEDLKSCQGIMPKIEAPA
jgi:hypothetical protein